jgi:hypothetical protein
MLKPGVGSGSACGVDGGRDTGRQRLPSQRVPRLHFGRVRTGAHFSPSQRVPWRQVGCAGGGCSATVSHEVPFHRPLPGQTQNSPPHTRPPVQAGTQRSPCRVWPSGHGGCGSLSGPRVLDCLEMHTPSSQ